MLSTRIGRCAIASALVFAVTGGAWAVMNVEWFQPSQRLGDWRWTTNATPAELRETSERASRNPFGDHHDACILLITYGDTSSIPTLIGALRRHSGIEHCHCLEALREITGVDAGDTFEDWERWERGG